MPPSKKAASMAKPHQGQVATAELSRCQMKMLNAANTNPSVTR